MTYVVTLQAADGSLARISLYARTATEASNAALRQAARHLHQREGWRVLSAMEDWGD